MPLKSSTNPCRELNTSESVIWAYTNTNQQSTTNNPHPKNIRAYRKMNFRRPNQRFVAVNLAHQNQPIKSDHAAFRILGCFGSESEFQGYVSEFQTATGLPCLVVETGQLFPVLKNLDDYRKIDESIQERTREMKEYYMKKFLEKEQALDKRPENEDDDKTKEANEKKEEEETQTTEDEETKISSNTSPNVPYSLRLAERFFVMSVYRDPNAERSEHAFTCWGATSTVDEAKQYLKQVQAIETTSDLFICESCKWFSLEQLTTPGYHFLHNTPFEYQTKDAPAR